MVSADVDTGAALEALPFPLVVMADCAAVLTALLDAALAVDVVEAAFAFVSARDTTLLDTTNVGLLAEAAAAESGRVAGGVEAAEGAVTTKGDPACALFGPHRRVSERVAVAD
jgi:hypothetical protein